MTLLKHLNPQQIASLMDEVLQQNELIGGSRTIQYGELVVTVPLRDIKAIINRFQRRGASYRKRVIASVVKALEHDVPLVKEQRATQAQALACAEDIAIWFGNEVIEGRQTLSIN